MGVNSRKQLPPSQSRTPHSTTMQKIHPICSAAFSICFLIAVTRVVTCIAPPSTPHSSKSLLLGSTSITLPNSRTQSAARPYTHHQNNVATIPSSTDDEVSLLQG
ncbi:hypothetical protein BGZ94_008454, partial [Podila epigama]